MKCTGVDDDDDDSQLYVFENKRLNYMDWLIFRKMMKNTV